MISGSGDSGNSPPTLPKDSRARRIGQLEDRMAIVVDGLLQLTLAVRALASAGKAPVSYVAELEALAERIYGATLAEGGPAAEDPGDGDGG